MHPLSVKKAVIILTLPDCFDPLVKTAFRRCFDFTPKASLAKPAMISADGRIAALINRISSDRFGGTLIRTICKCFEDRKVLAIVCGGFIALAKTGQESPDLFRSYAITKAQELLRGNDHK